MGKKKISVGTWAYIWGGYAEDPIPLEAALDRVQELGFDGVELAAFPPHLAPEDFPYALRQLSEDPAGADFPTDFESYRIWRCKSLLETISLSTILRYFMPIPVNLIADSDPSPPTPIMQTLLLDIFFCPSYPISSRIICLE